jgi:hypothetical protein
MPLQTITLLLKAEKVQLCKCKSDHRVTLKAAKKNKEVIYIGSSDLVSGNGFPIEPGELLPLPQVDYDTLYVVGKEGDSLYLLIWK